MIDGRSRSLLLLSFAAISLTAFLSAIRPPAAVASPGDLDPSFGRHGKVASYLGRPTHARAVTVQPDGKLLVVSPGYVFRYLPNGRLDPSFGAGDGQAPAPAAVLALQPDGKIVVGGGDSLARLNPDGALDRTFGDGDGVATTDAISIEAIALQPDGKIVAGGSSWPSGTPGFAVARFASDGTIDTTFADEGVLVVNGGGEVGYNVSSANALAIQPAGKIVAAGAFGAAPPLFCHGCGTYWRAAIVRITPQGEFDESFSGDGVFMTRVIEIATSLALRPHGGVVFTGDAGGIRLVALTAAGALAPGFGGGDGVATAHFDGFARGTAVTIQSTGRIVAVGVVRPAPRRRPPPSASPRRSGVFGVARYWGNGKLDPSFGDRGRVTTPIGDASEANAVALWRGRIVAAGLAHDLPIAPGRYRIALARYFGGI